MTRLRCGFIAMLAFSLLFALTPTLARADNEEDESPEEMLDVNAQAFEMPENQFDQWVFQNLQTATAARSKLEKMLTLQSEDVHRACELTEAQARKLQLAGRGDIKRFFEKVEVVRQKFLLVRKDQQRFNDIWQDIQPLQTVFADGLFSDGSIFRKTLKNTLDERQYEHYAKLQRERNLFRYRAKVELVVAMLENAVPMRDEQRQKLITFIIDETPTPHRFGQWDYYLVMWNLSKIPETKLKPLFDATQWKALAPQLAQGRGMEQWLKQSGALLTEEETDELKAEKPQQGMR